MCLTGINIDFRSSEMPPPLPNNGTFKSMCWTFVCRLNIIIHYVQNYDAANKKENIIQRTTNFSYVDCFVRMLYY